jgi:hypothetical protein
MTPASYSCPTSELLRKFNQKAGRQSPAAQPTSRTNKSPTPTQKRQRECHKDPTFPRRNGGGGGSSSSRRGDSRSRRRTRGKSRRGAIRIEPHWAAAPPSRRVEAPEAATFFFPSPNESTPGANDGVEGGREEEPFGGSASR